MSPANPTAKTYAALNRAFDFFNDRLLGGELPACLVTLQRKNKAYGYFAGGRFGSKDGAEITDEIALNPSHFKSRTDEQSLSTLAHEMAHLWQHHFGKTRYTCTSCELHAWAKPGVRLVCGECDEPMAAEDGEDD